MAKVMNLGVHCSECIHYQGIRPFMYCMALQKRILLLFTQFFVYGNGKCNYFC